MSEMLDAAITLAQRGWPVFPCTWTDGPKAKSPLVSGGFHAATRDPAQITKWWHRWPLAMIGSPVHWRLLALDIDPRHGGSRSAVEQRAGCHLPSTPTCWSGRGDGGCHIYLQRPGGDITGAGLPPGVDLREGGKHYCIIPPSRHPSTGQPYRWEGSGQPAPCPPGLATLLAVVRPPRPLVPVQSASRRVQGLVAKVASAPEGSRSNILYFSAVTLANLGQLDGAEDQLAEAAAIAGLTPREINGTLRSARRAAR